VSSHNHIWTIGYLGQASDSHGNLHHRKKGRMEVNNVESTELNENGRAADRKND
jgi:D-aminopeptidase